jgi:glycosyltransferase involved in cell wall biosynthesis
MTEAEPTRLVEVYAQSRGASFDCSIIVPVFDGARFLAECIPSVLGQAGVTCDILISDDCSEDGSLEAILALVKDYRGPHSVRVYQTSQNARNLHVPLLVGASHSDRIIQAHQDDISDPERARVLSAALDGKVKLVTSVARIKTASGVTEPTAEHIDVVRKNDRFKTYLSSNRGVMIGSRFATHRDLFERFPPLSPDYLSGGQDIILPIRATIIGRAKVIFTPLLTIGDHPDRWSYRLFDSQDKATRDFDFALRRLVVLDVAMAELKLARQAGLVDKAKARRIQKRLKEASKAFTVSLARNRELALRRGFLLTWTNAVEPATASAPIKPGA